MSLNERAFPDRDQDYIYEHLRHLYRDAADARNLPAVKVALHRTVPMITGAVATITAGHKYFRIAREVGLPSIRATIDGDE